VPGGGLRRGSTVVVEAAPGLGGLSLALSLLTASSANGHWAGVVGVDDPGVVAMAELGVDLRRVLFVPRPRGAWPSPPRTCSTELICWSCVRLLEPRTGSRAN